MIIQAYRLLRKLKKAQMSLDGIVGIDEDEMTATTIHQMGQKYKEISLKRYQDSLVSTLEYLKEQGCIAYERTSYIQVTYSGWYYFSATLVDTFRGLILNVIIPIVVSVIAAVVTTLLMSSTGLTP